MCVLGKDGRTHARGQEESGRELQEPGSPVWTADSSKQFADIAAGLYTDEAHWHLAQAHGKHPAEQTAGPGLHKNPTKPSRCCVP